MVGRGLEVISSDGENARGPACRMKIADAGNVGRGVGVTRVP